MFEPTAQDFWRAIILYGRNMSTYKMGLGHLLINYANKNSQKIPLHELGEDFLNLYQDRTKTGKPQGRRKIVDGVESGLTYVEQESQKILQDGKSQEKAVNDVLKNSLENLKWVDRVITILDVPLLKNNDDSLAERIKNSRIISICGYHGWPHYKPWQIRVYLNSKERFIKR